MNRPDPHGFMAEFYQMSKELTAIFSQTFKNRRGGNISQWVLWSQCYILIPKADKDITKKL